MEGGVSVGTGATTSGGSRVIVEAENYCMSQCIVWKFEWLGMGFSLLFIFLHIGLMTSVGSSSDWNMCVFFTQRLCWVCYNELYHQSGFWKVFLCCEHARCSSQEICSGPTTQLMTNFTEVLFSMRGLSVWPVQMTIVVFVLLQWWVVFHATTKALCL